MPQPVVHFEISTKDRAKITDFYSQLFGWQVNADNPMNYGLANTKDGELGIDGGPHHADTTDGAMGEQANHAGRLGFHIREHYGLDLQRRGHLERFGRRGGSTSGLLGEAGAFV